MDALAGVLVFLCIYNLNRQAGLLEPACEYLTRALIGQDAIWHSAIVVRDQEYYFGYGIEARPAGQTMFGAPTEVITLGTTFMTEAELKEALVAAGSGEFAASKYGLLHNNCNTFSNHLSHVLIGTGIPEHILKQGVQVLNTHTGQQLLPLLARIDPKLADNLYKQEIKTINRAIGLGDEALRTSRNAPTAAAVQPTASAMTITP